MDTEDPAITQAKDECPKYRGLIALRDAYNLRVGAKPGNGLAGKKILTREMGAQPKRQHRGHHELY